MKASPFQMQDSTMKRSKATFIYPTVSKMKKSYPHSARKQENVLIKKASKHRKKVINTRALL